MSLDQYKMLKAVAELGGLKSASEVLHKTQPAVSQGIKQLESRLGLKLFDRQGYRLRLTKSGQVVYQQIQRVLDEDGKLQELVQHFHGGHEAKIHLALNASFPIGRFLPVLQGAQQMYANTQIVMSQEYVTGAIQRMLDQEADIAVSPLEMKIIQSGQFDTKLIDSMELVNVSVPGIQPDDLKLSSMLNKYQIVVKDTGRGSGAVDLGVQEGQRRWYVNDFNTKKEFILSGIGWGRLPRHLVDKELSKGTLIQLQLDEMPSILNVPFYLIRRRKDWHGPVSEYLWNAISGLD